MIPSPNIWNHPDVYEIENLGVDPDGLIEATMAGIHDWSGRRVLDLGCGSGFHLPSFARTALTVVRVTAYKPLSTCAATDLTGVVDQRVGARGRSPKAALGRSQRRDDPRPMGLLLRTGVRARTDRGGEGAATRRDGVRDRQRRLAIDVRRLVPQGHAGVRPGSDRTFLGASGLVAREPRHPMVLPVTRRLRVSRADRVHRGPRRRDPG